MSVLSAFRLFNRARVFASVRLLYKGKLIPSDPGVSSNEASDPSLPGENGISSDCNAADVIRL